MRRLHKTKKLLRGRPNGDDTRTVLDMIEASGEPISTKTLITKLAEITKPESIESKLLESAKKLAAWENRCTAVRTMLRAKEQQGEIQCLGVGSDGSLLWIHKKVPIMQCAALVANEFLKSRQATTRLNPEEFEQWAETGQDTAGEY